MYIAGDRIGGYDQTVQTVQIRLRKGDRHVSTTTSPMSGAGSFSASLCVRSGVIIFKEELIELDLLHGRYAYFKKLTYFSTECIYSPDGQYFSWPPLTRPMGVAFSPNCTDFLPLATSTLQHIVGTPESFSKTSKRSVRRPSWI
jgi:hypothetical protein